MKLQVNNKNKFYCLIKLTNNANSNANNNNNNNNSA
jgi:hypothetical protein